MIIPDTIEWSEGERLMHSLLHVPTSNHENPTAPFLAPQYGRIIVSAPLLAVGTRDKEGRPWTTVWGGQRGFARPINQFLLGVKASVDGQFDPVIEILRDKKDEALVSTLGIDPANRRRAKMMGRIAGVLVENGSSETEVQMLVKVEQSLGKLIISYRTSMH
jgi:hypothetical protein